MLREDGGIKALLGMVRSGNSDVIAQVARGLANFAKCESRGIIQGLQRLYFQFSIIPMFRCQLSSLSLNMNYLIHFRTLERLFSPNGRRCAYMVDF